MTIEVVSPATVHPRNDAWRHIVVLDNGTRQQAVCFSSSAADELKPGPLPPDWRVKQGEHGPILEPPRKPGGFGGGGFRNSEAGVRLEQDRIDRRLAVQLAARAGGFDRAVADAVLAWLKAAR